MGETRVDLLHLLEDLRDAYPGALEETILTEIIANSLDSGATLIRVGADPREARLTVIDDGRGMQSTPATTTSPPVRRAAATVSASPASASSSACSCARRC